MTYAKYDETMMRTAFEWATHSTCGRLSVGVVFSRDERILIQGYNGAPKGMPHCDHRCNCNSREIPFPQGSPLVKVIHENNCNTNPHACKAVHAEQNAIAWAARVGAPLHGSTVYCTHQPCIICARLLITVGVRRVVYAEPYRLVDGLDLLKQAHISITRLELAA